MIVRPFTILAGLAFVASGAVMFVVKHHSHMLNTQISAINDQTRQDEQSIRVLQAQWALEADPSRLAALAAQFTGLQPMKPGQLVTLAALGKALPPPGAQPPGANPEDPVPVMPQLAAASPVTPPAQAVAMVAAPNAVPMSAAAPATTPAPVRMAAAIMPPPVAKPVRATVTKPAVPERLAAESVSEVVPVAPPPRYYPAYAHAAVEQVPARQAAAPRREGDSSLYLAAASAPARAHAVPMGAQLVPVRDVAPPPPPVPVPVDNGGSLLGMAQGGSQ